MKRTINKFILLPIPVPLLESWKVDIKWKDLIKIEGILPDDSVKMIEWKLQEFPNFGYSEPNNSQYYVPYLVVEREVEETDEQYLERMREEAKNNKEKEDEERLLYLKLKAKFEQQ